MATVHVLPVGDLVTHELDVTCVCRPETAPVLDDGRVAGFLVTHSSLDGRELHEREWRERLICRLYRLVGRCRAKWLIVPEEATEGAVGGT